VAGPQVTTSPSGDEVFELLDELRDAGFSLGIREHIIAQELAVTCRPEDGDLDPVRLRNWLAPVLCNSPEEQREFYRVYQAWWSRRVPVRRTGSDGAGQKEPVSDETILKKSLPWKWMISFVGLLVLVAAAVFLADQFHLHLVVVPDLAGSSSNDAQRVLEELGLVAGVQPEISDQPVGIILRQEPAAGRRVPSGSTVVLVVASPVQDLLKLPDLAGLESEEALRRLSELGLSGKIAGREASERPEGTVLRQEPPGGSVPRGVTVRLWIAAAVPRNALEITVNVVDQMGNPVPSASVEATVWPLQAKVQLAPLVQTDGEGFARLSLNPPKLFSVLVHHPDFQPAASASGQSGPGLLALRAELSPSADPPTPWLVDHAETVRLLAGSVPLVAAAFWCAWALYRRRLVLERRTSRETQDLAHVRLAEPKHNLYRGETFVRARIEARRRQAAAEGELDLDATVDRTIRRLGFFSPVFRPRSRLPAYLALVDRAGFHDQQARLVEEFLDRLREGGVAVDSYTFDRDPRLCTPSRGSDGTYRSLWELSSLHAEHRLLVFGDGVGLANPVTGRVAAWTEGFSPWSERALLTPVPACHWTAHEVELAGAGFRVVPFTPAGLRLFVQSLQPTELRPALLEWRAPYPPLLAEQPARWRERIRPRQEELDELCWQLRAYLGPDGFRWFCGLAVYPEIDWFFTLYIGLGLRTVEGLPLLSEEPLLALARLPWLRLGYMPDWLRLRLVSELGEEDGRTVRGLLENLLRLRLESPGSRFQLDVALAPATPGGRRWRRFFTDLLRTEPSDSPLQDFVFVEFLLGKRPKKLQVRAPSGWRRWVYHRGLRSLGIKPVVVMTGAALIAFTAVLGARPLIESIYPAPTPAAPSRITQTAFTPAAVTVEIPKLVGLSLAAAVRALEGARLKLGSSDSKDQTAIVTLQSPGSGTIAAEGSSVDLRTRPATGLLQIVGYPKGASSQRLTIDGEKWAGRTPVPLPAGEHTLAFDAGKYGIVTRKVTIARGQTTRFSLPPEALPRWNPLVKSIWPPSGYQGAEVRLSITGRDLGSVRTVEIEGSGVIVKSLVYSPESARVSPYDDGVLIPTLVIAPDAMPGERAITVVNSTGQRSRLKEMFTVLPAAGQQRQEQTTSTVLVPNVIGLATSAADANLRRLRLNPQFDRKETSDRCILMQNPRAGTRVQPGADVSLKIGPCPARKY
jgi:beta-lactam-binding protein with PASTA domain